MGGRVEVRHQVVVDAAYDALLVAVAVLSATLFFSDHEAIMQGGLPPVNSLCHSGGKPPERETEMGTKTDVEQMKAKAAAMTAKLSDEALCLAWMATESQPVTQELAITRGWMLDELNTRLGDDLFDEWLFTVDENGETPNPLAFFERKGN